MDRTVCRSGHARDRKPSVATILIATHIPVAGMARSYKSGVQPGNLMHSRNNLVLSRKNLEQVRQNPVRSQ